MHDAFKLAPHEWAQLRALLDDALALPAADRPAWVDALDEARHALLKPRLRGLLAHAADAGAAAPETVARLLDTLPKVETGQFAPAPETTAAPAERIGPYRLIRELGSGGMASVWLAERTDMLQRRQVALKLPHGAWRRAGLAERMAREREILATLEHPNIARLYDAGVAEDGQPYLALEYVEGERIDARCERSALDVPARLQLFLQVARAVSYAHTQLVVHRDLKPSNILVTADGQAKLLDFGIAKLLDQGQAAETALTQQAGHALTPDYAAPEQILGKPIGTAADVYALGVLLFELLAGQRPYKLKRDTRAALEDAILHAEVPRPSSVAPEARQRALRGDLDTIVLKALKRQPHERYGTVAALTEDIGRHLQQRPVLAQPDSAAYRAAKFVRRNRLAVGAAGAVSLTLVAGIVVAAWQARRAVSEQQRAEQALAFVTSIFRDADPAIGPGRQPSAAELLLHARKRLDVQFADRPTERIELLNVLAESLDSVQDLAAANEAASSALHEAQALNGPGDEQALRARAVLVSVQRGRGDNTALRTELEALLPLLRADPARHATRLVQAGADWAELELGEGRYEQAEASARAALADADRLGGRHDVQRAALWKALAVSLEARTQYAPALQAAGEATRHAEIAFADRPRHPQMINTRLIHARNLGISNRFDEALSMMERCVNDAREVYGADSRTVGQYLQNLTVVRVRAGRLVEAQHSAQEALEILLKHFAPDAPHVGAALDALAFVHFNARRPEQAIPLYDRTMAIVEKHFGAQSEHLYTQRMRRATMMAWQGRLAEALPVLRSVAEDYGRVGKNTLSAPLHHLGVAERLDGRPEPALQLQQRALAAVREGPQAQRERLGIRFEIGLAQQALGRLDEAQASLVAALREWDDLKLRPMPVRSDAALALGRIHLARGRPADALDGLRQADAYWQVAGPDTPWAGEAAYWVGRAMQAGGDMAGARAAVARALPALARSHRAEDRARLREAQAAPFN